AIPVRNRRRLCTNDIANLPLFPSAPLHPLPALSRRPPPSRGSKPSSRLPHDRGGRSRQRAGGGKGPSAGASRLHLAFELIEESPIGVLGDDPLRRRLDQTDFTQAQGVEADRVLRIVFAPTIVGNILERLQRVVVAPRKAAIDEPPRGALGLRGAEV